MLMRQTSKRLSRRSSRPKQTFPPPFAEFENPSSLERLLPFSDGELDDDPAHVFPCSRSIRAEQLSRNNVKLPGLKSNRAACLAACGRYRSANRFVPSGVRGGGRGTNRPRKKK